MPQFTIVEHVAPERMDAVVPPAYRALMRAVVRPAQLYTVALFKHDREDVVTSAPVRRALAGIAAGVTIVAIGGNFTREALELLEAREASVVRLGEFYWTDESVRTLP